MAGADLEGLHDPLTADEHRALALSADLAKAVRRIIGDGPAAAGDWAEAAAAVHVVQRMIAGQAAARAYPARYRLLGQVIPRPDAERG